jgi:predicted HicB family RNase H-like nuclease
MAMEYKGYRARVSFDAEAGVLFGEVEGLRDVVTFEATTVRELSKAFHASVDDYLAMCAERGEEPEHSYSGKFLVRVDPELHRDLVAAATRARKSLNAFARETLQEVLRQAPPRRSRTPSAHVEAANARSVGETFQDFISADVRNTNADSQRQASIWSEITKDTPASITPARQSNTPATPNSAGPNPVRGRQAA